MDGSVIPPQETANDEVENIGNRNKKPEDLSKQILRTHQEDRVQVLSIPILSQVFLECLSFDDIDRQDDGTTNDGKYHK